MRPLCIPCQIQPLRRLDLRDQQEDWRVLRCKRSPGAFADARPLVAPGRRARSHRLAEAFAATLNAPWLRLRLEVVTGNACREFHVDNVTARLVCTYPGTGTQLGLAPRGAEPEGIHTVPTGQPIILLGMRWPTTPPSLLKHPSPPIADTGEARLLLVLDPILDPEDEV